MPNPLPNEDKETYVSRCIKVVMDNGEAKDDKQAAAICYSKWDEAVKAELPEEPIALSIKSEGQVIPTRKFIKEIARVGSYGRGKINITTDHIKHWADTFNRMKFTGFKVPVPVGHTTAAEANRGWVREMTASEDGTRLMATIEAIGEDSINTLARNDVSIYSPSKFTDTKGREWTQPITHVAITSTPLVSGMADPIAASDTSTQILPVEILMADTPEMPMEESKTEEAPKVETKTFTLVIPEGMTPGSYTAKLVIEEAEEAPEAPEAPAAPQTVAASEIVLDPKVFKLSQDNTNLKLSKLVENGNITPAVSKKLAELVNETYVCSGQLSLDLVLDIMAENKALDMTPKAKPQAVVLAPITDQQAETYGQWASKKYAK